MTTWRVLPVSDSIIRIAGKGARLEKGLEDDLAALLDCDGDAGRAFRLRQ